MAANNGYTSQPSYMLYDTTGGTEDWTYYATGGLGFTFEIGLTGLPPAVRRAVAEYEGTTPAAGAGKGGNREAYFKALENTADSSKHSTLTGKAPPGTVLRLKKSFTTETSPVIDAERRPRARVRTFPDTLDTTMVTPFDGDLPLGHQPVHAAGRGAGQGPAGHRQPQRPRSPSAARRPRRRAPTPALVVRPTCYNDYAFTGSGRGRHGQRQGHGQGASGTTPVTDYDITVYKDINGDGQSGGRDQGRRHLGPGQHHQRDHQLRRARRGHRRASATWCGSSTSRAG